MKRAVVTSMKNCRPAAVTVSCFQSLESKQEAYALTWLKKQPAPAILINLKQQTFSFFSSFLGCFLAHSGKQCGGQAFYQQHYLRFPHCPVTAFAFGPGVTAQAGLWRETTKPRLCPGCSECQPLIRLNFSAHLKNLHTIFRWATERDAPAM